jgi:alpha-L-rhamnosidase
MNSLSRFLWLPVLLAGFHIVMAAEPAPAPALENLRCEYRAQPVGMDVTEPRLSWTLASDQRGQRQTAYQILATASAQTLAEDRGDLWDSGRVASDQSSHIVYHGTSLLSRMQVWWKVRIWDKDGRPTAWSPPASWTMGLLNKSDWRPKWIADPAGQTNAATRGPLNGYHSHLTNLAHAVQWVAVDLGQPRDFDAVRLFPARPYDWQPDTPGFLFSLRFKIEAASRADFADARVVLDHTASDEPNPGTNAPLYRWPPATARFVRLVMTQLRPRDGNNYAFALAEMQVLNGATNLAQGTQVTALDSIETGPWAKANLTDGVTVTIPPGGGGPAALPATLLRKSFTLPGPVRRATAYATAFGLYELHLNGGRVGDQLLTPEWTSYRRRVQYQAYDVTSLLHPGENAVGALLGEGWYAGRLMVVGRFAYGAQPRFLLQLEIELADGRREMIVTDDSWQASTDGPIRSAGIYDGEVYDARQEMSGWDGPGFVGVQWRPVQVFDLGPEQLIWQRNEPIRVVQELKPIKLSEPKPGVYVFDLGQNLVGRCRVEAVGAAGQTVTLRHAEMLTDDGHPYVANLRGAPQVDRYTPRRDGAFVFEPRFTYHGFRFVELTGLAAAPRVDSVVGQVFHSTAPEVGVFECSDPSLTQLLRNILWTQRANLMSTPNDCPQRDERFGWMGDIQAFSQTAIFNMDLAAFFTKFAQDIRDDQADDGRFPDFAPHPGNPNQSFSGVPAWGDAGVIVPWRSYVNYADQRLLAAHFDAARRWVDYIQRLNPDLIWAKGRHNDYNDWLNGDWIKQAGWPSKGGSVPQEVFATAFFAHSTELVAKMAAAIGRPEEARRYGELFQQIKAAFNRRFVRPDGRIQGDTQGGHALALHFQLLPDESRPKAAQFLAENIRAYQNHLSTGIQTTHRAMLELSRQGYHELAWQLLTNRTFPSWLYMLDNGATTIWERWDGYVKGRGFQDPGMNSFNHWALGAVGEWVWRYALGLNPDEDQPGYKHFRLAPQPGGGVTWARGEYRSMHGLIRVAWKKEASFLLEITVPANATATVMVPAQEASRVTESGQPAAQAEGVRYVRMENGAAVFEVQSGRYAFVSGP